MLTALFAHHVQYKINPKVEFYITELVQITNFKSRISVADMAYSPIPISVNISFHQFEQPNLVEKIVSILHNTELEGK